MTRKTKGFAQKLKALRRLRASDSLKKNRSIKKACLTSREETQPPLSVIFWNGKRRRVLILDGIITCGIIQLGTVVCNLGHVPNFKEMICLIWRRPPPPLAFNIVFIRFPYFPFSPCPLLSHIAAVLFKSQGFSLLMWNAATFSIVVCTRITKWIALF